jgi:hypothetical protein
MGEYTMERDQDIIQKSIQQSIDELTEWQDNQYNPGYYIGGITPNNLLKPRKPMVLGGFLIIIALSSFVTAGLLFYSYLDQRAGMISIEKFLDLIYVIGTAGFGILMLVGGILKIRKHQSKGW